jgi:hypothetical protein
VSLQPQRGGTPEAVANLLARTTLHERFEDLLHAAIAEFDRKLFAVDGRHGLIAEYIKTSCSNFASGLTVKFETTG